MTSWLYTVVAVSPRVELRPYPDGYVDFVAKATKLRIDHPTEVVSLGSWFDGWNETFREVELTLPDAARVLDWQRDKVEYQVYCFGHRDAVALARAAVAARRRLKRHDYGVNAMVDTLRAASVFAQVCEGDMLIAVKNIGASLGDGELGNGRLPNELFRHSNRREGRR